jgi:hypothetical protein
MMQFPHQDSKEADRDNNPTNLCLAIEERDWDGVKYQVENFRDEAKTWICRRDPITKALRWRVLPIHAALLNCAPGDVVVRHILMEFPTGYILDASMLILVLLHLRSLLYSLIRTLRKNWTIRGCSLSTLPSKST